MGKTLYTITKHKLNNYTAELLVKEDFTYTEQDRLVTRLRGIVFRAR